MLALKSENMRSNDDFNIEFAGLKLGHHNFEFDISETFFDDYNYCDFLSNGFKIRDNGSEANRSAANFVFMAFADTPFKYANAR